MEANTEIFASADPGAGLNAARLRSPDGRSWNGPLGHLADERDRLLERSWKSFEAQMLGTTIGAVLTNIDLSEDLADDTIDEIYEALDAYKVIFFRDQHLTTAEHLAFTRRFGEPEIHPFIPSSKEYPEMLRFEKGADSGGYENIWHHDVTWRESPSKATILRIVEVPPVGGDTLFADMCAAYDGLPEDLRSEADDLTAIHDNSLAFGRRERREKIIPEDRIDEIRELYPPVEHPVVCTHERTGRRHLYVNRIFVDHFTDRDRDESLSLLDQFCRQADFPEYQCRFTWEPGSLAFYDNRAVQHYANSDYWPHIRIMERTSIIGNRPRQ